MLRVDKMLTGDGIGLHPKARGVFDRMLASDDQIANAERVRVAINKQNPLFPIGVIQL